MVTKPKVQELEPFICNECSHTWDKKAHAKKQCPKCGSVNVDSNGTAFRVDEATGEKTVILRDKDASARPPMAVLDRALAGTGKEQFVKDEDLVYMESDFARLLNDMGVGLPNMITMMVFNGDIEDPELINKKLARYHVKPWKRQMIIDAWCQDKGIPQVDISVTDQEKAQGLGSDSDDMDGSMDRMIKKMERMATMKMYRDMFMPQQAQPQFQQPPQRQDQMVPMLDEGGMTIMDTEGHPVMVPAWQFQMMEQRRIQAKREAEALLAATKPSEMQSALALAKEFMEMAGSKNDPEMMIKLQELSGQVQLKEIQGTMGRQMDALQAQVAQQQVVDQVQGQMGAVIEGYKKQAEEMSRKLEDLQKDRMRNIEDTQVRMQSEINSTMTEAVKEGLVEFRATRRDGKDLLKEQLRAQQYPGQQGPYPPGTQPGYSPVQELTPAQLQAEFSGRGLVGGEVYYGEDFTVAEGEEEVRHY